MSDTVPDEAPQAGETTDDGVHGEANPGGSRSVTSTMPVDPSPGPDARLQDILETEPYETSWGEHEVVVGGRTALRIKRHDGQWLTLNWNGVIYVRSQSQIDNENDRKSSVSPEAHAAVGAAGEATSGSTPDDTEDTDDDRPSWNE